MAFWSKTTWEQRGPTEKIVDPWSSAQAEEAGYRLSVGAEYYTNEGDGGKIKSLAEKEGFVIGPGQFVYILTAETVSIPLNCIGFISARATTKFRGLVNVSGFQVDPGYRGKLIFAMFNAGPMHIHLRQGDQIFSIWLSDLIDSVPQEFEGTDNIPDGLSSIPSSIVSGISSKALTAYQVNDAVASLRDELTKVKERLVYLGTAMAVIFAMAIFFVGPELRDRLSGFFDFSDNVTDEVLTEE